MSGNMLSDVLKEIDDLYDRLKCRYSEINSIKKIASVNPSNFIEDNGRLFGIEEAIDEILITRANVDDAINKFLGESMDGQYSVKMGLLQDEVNLLGNKLHIANIELEKYDKIKKDNSKEI